LPAVVFAKAGALPFAVALLAGLPPAVPNARAQAAPPRAPVVAITQHTGTFNGQTVKYSASVGETLIPGPDGRPAAVMINTAYVREDVPDKTKRPVMFVFNGGPGASSSPLHMSAFGPRRRAAGGAGIIDNPYSPLDTVDLVFIDPIGTGFSRPLPGVDGQPFWSVSGDGASVKTFIQSWLKAHGRDASPRFLCGESYGTVRAGQIIYLGHQAKDLAFDGVLLFSLPGRPGTEELSHALTFPAFAVTAAYHGKADANGRTPATIFEEAARFARTDYIGALIEGDGLSATDKRRVAREMSAWIGLSSDFIESKNLRISKSDFMMNVLKDRGMRTGQLDGRASGAIETYANRQPPYDDPSMSRPTTPPGAPSGSSAGATTPNVPPPNALQTYMTEELKFPAKDTYRGLNLEINAKWKYDVDGALEDTAQRIGVAMRNQSNLRLFWAAGYYDITTPLAGGRYTLEHAGMPRDRLTIAAFATGHSVFDGDDNLSRFTDAVRTFVTTRN
jgi:carboxypeptidase C (cathepsin A)